MIGTFKEFIEYCKQDPYQRNHAWYYNIPYIDEENPLMNFDTGLVLEGSYRGKCLQFITVDVDRKDFHRILQLREFEGKTSDKEIEKMLQDYEKLNQKEEFVTDLCNIFILGATIIMFFICIFVVQHFYPETKMPIYIDKIIIMILAGIISGIISEVYLTDWHGFSRGQNVH